MKRREFVKKAAGSTAGVGVLAACGQASEGATAQESGIEGPQVTWNLASSYPPSLDILHGASERFAERVSALTGGNFRIRVFPAGEIVPGGEVMDAVQQGSVQAGYTASYYYIGKSPALAFDTAVPFGLTARQQAAWCYYGGGLEEIRRVYSDFGIVHFPAANTGTQMGGWFRRPVNTLGDLRGLRFRIPGMGGEIMARLGVSVQGLQAAEIYPALERGAIDGTEWVGPYDDEKLGFHQVAKNYYMPGWWEPGAGSSVLVSQREYDRLPLAYQEVLMSASKEIMTDTMARYDVANPQALARLVNDHGVTLRTFSDEIMEAAWRESNAYLEEQAAADATFRRVYESFKAFRDQAFPYFAGNEASYARFAFGKIPSSIQVAAE
jgi:TRAP-type mannitol/chloroaromatic compound transport system substrate-binding protein